MQFFKHLSCFILIFFFSTAIFAQSCDEQNGFQIRTQEDVDNFQIKYPGCTELLNSLNIGYPDSGITNLDGFSGIEIIHGDLRIDNQLELTDLSPLNDIHTINGYLSIDDSGITEMSFNNLKKVQEVIFVEGNPELKMLDSFNSLDSIGGLDISRNDKLEQILGFDSLKHVDETLFISNNDNLQEVDAFSELKTIGNDFYFADNISLQQLSRFENLEFVGDVFIFRGSGGPVELSGFNALKTVNGPFRIRDNDGLLGVDGFQILDSLRQYGEVENNPQLQSFRGFNSLISVRTDLLFSNNESLKFIEGFDALNIVGGLFDVSENDSLQFVDGFQNLEQIGQDFTLNENFHLEEFIPLINLQEVAGSINLEDNFKLENLDGLGALKSINGRFGIEGNDSLLQIDGLRSLRSINGDFSIRQNENLLHLDGLSTLESISGGLLIQSNAVLNSIRGIANIDPRSLDGDSWFDLNISFNPNLSYCAYKSICDLLLLPDSFYNIGSNAPGCNFEDEILCQERGILGTVFYDQNENGVRDIDDFGVPNQSIKIFPDDDRVVSYIDGRYSIFLEFDKPYEISWEQDPEWRLTTGNPVETFTLVQDMLDNDRFDFGIIRNEDFIGASTHLVQEQVVCNETSTVDLIAQNLGTDLLSGILEMTYDELFEFESATPMPDEIDSLTQTLRWDLNSLHPFETFNVELHLLNPNELSLGDTLINHTKVYGAVNNELELLGDFVFTDLVLCAYDPNDKLVSPIGIGEEGEVLPGTPLDYTVRFQNTGNAPARNVSILDTIDLKLDMETFEVTNSSFKVQTVVRQNIVEFKFNDINLIDSLTNEPESHGFVSFSIEPLPGLPDPSVVENRAHIFFDFNPAIITNTTRTTYATPMVNFVNNLEEHQIIYLFPNPSEDRIYFGAKNNNAPLNLVSYEISNLSGQLLLRKRIQDEQSQYAIDIEDFNPGIYFLTLRSDQGQYISRFVKL